MQAVGLLEDDGNNRDDEKLTPNTVENEDYKDAP